MLLLAGSLLGQKPMAAHKITSYLEAFELDANDFLLQNLNEQVKPAPQQSQRSINSCVSIPGIPCDEGALDLLDFDFVPPGSINNCSVVADAGTDDNCFNPGDIPSGVTFSTTNDQGSEGNLITLG